MAIQYMTKKEFIKLPHEAVVWNRLGFHLKLWEPSEFMKGELRDGLGLWHQSKWRDDQFIRVPSDFVWKRKVKYFSLDKIEVSWKKKGAGSRKALNFEKEIEQFCKAKGLNY